MEDKAHQGDFYVLDVSFAQRVHKLLLAMNSVVSKWNPHSLGVCRRRWMDRQALHAGQGSQGTQGNLLPTWSSPRRSFCPIFLLIPSMWALTETKKGHNENLMSNFLQDQYFFSCKIWNNGRCKFNLEYGSPFLFKGVVTTRRELLWSYPNHSCALPAL